MKMNKSSICLIVLLLAIFCLTLGAESSFAGTITGFVYEQDGSTPIEGAYVIFTDYTSGWSPNVSTGINGGYISSDLPAGQYTVWAWKNGYVGAYWENTFSYDGVDPVSVTEDGTVADINFTLEKEATISGTVYQADGTTPITGTTISVAVYSGDPCGSYQHINGVSTNTADGTYTIGGLRSGTYFLRTDSNGSNYVSEWWASPASSLTCAGAQAIIVSEGDVAAGKNFQLDTGGIISGRVTRQDNGEPIANVWVGAQTWDGGWGGASLTDSDGSYTILGLHSGAYSVHSDGTVNLNDNWEQPFLAEYYNESLDRSSADSVTVTTGQETPNINFTLEEGASVSGTIYQSDGNTPVTGTQISVYAYSPFAGDPCGSYQFSYGVSTNAADGTYTISGLPAGTYFLRTDTIGSNYLGEWWASPASSVDCAGAQSVTVAAGEAITGKNFQLERGGIISGRITRQDNGDPIPNAEVYAYTSDYTNSEYGESDSEGYFSLGGLGTGSYYVAVSGYTYFDGNWEQRFLGEYYDNSLDENGATLVSVTAGSETTGVGFSLEQGATISGNVYQSDGTTPITGEMVRVNLYTGDPCGPYQQVTGVYGDPSNGAYTIGGLPAGTYFLKASPNGDQYLDEWWASPASSVDCGGAQSVTVTTGEAITGKDFQLERGGIISGRITRQDNGDPIPNAEVYAYTSDYTNSEYGESDSEGYFSLGGLGTGSYYVAVSGYTYSDGNYKKSFLEEYYDNSQMKMAPVWSPSPPAVKQRVLIFSWTRVELFPEELYDRIMENPSRMRKYMHTHRIT